MATMPLKKLTLRALLLLGVIFVAAVMVLDSVLGPDTVEDVYADTSDSVVQPVRDPGKKVQPETDISTLEQQLTSTQQAATAELHKATMENQAIARNAAMQIVKQKRQMRLLKSQMATEKAHSQAAVQDREATIQALAAQLKQYTQVVRDTGEPSPKAQRGVTMEGMKNQADKLYQVPQDSRNPGLLAAASAKEKMKKAAMKIFGVKDQRRSQMPHRQNMVVAEKQQKQQLISTEAIPKPKQIKIGLSKSSEQAIDRRNDEEYLKAKALREKNKKLRMENNEADTIAITRKSTVLKRADVQQRADEEKAIKKQQRMAKFFKNANEQQGKGYEKSKMESLAAERDAKVLDAKVTTLKERVNKETRAQHAQSKRDSMTLASMHQESQEADVTRDHAFNKEKESENKRDKLQKRSTEAMHKAITLNRRANLARAVAAADASKVRKLDAQTKAMQRAEAASNTKATESTNKLGAKRIQLKRVRMEVKQADKKTISVEAAFKSAKKVVKRQNKSILNHTVGLVGAISRFVKGTKDTNTVHLAHKIAHKIDHLRTKDDLQERKHKAHYQSSVYKWEETMSELQDKAAVKAKMKSSNHRNGGSAGTGKSQKALSSQDSATPASKNLASNAPKAVSGLEDSSTATMTEIPSTKGWKATPTVLPQSGGLRSEIKDLVKGVKTMAHTLEAGMQTPPPIQSNAYQLEVSQARTLADQNELLAEARARQYHKEKKLAQECSKKLRLLRKTRSTFGKRSKVLRSKAERRYQKVKRVAKERGVKLLRLKHSEAAALRNSELAKAQLNLYQEERKLTQGIKQQYQKEKKLNHERGTKLLSLHATKLAAQKSQVLVQSKTHQYEKAKKAADEQRRKIWVLKKAKLEQKALADRQRQQLQKEKQLTAKEHVKQQIFEKTKQKMKLVVLQLAEQDAEKKQLAQKLQNQTKLAKSMTLLMGRQKKNEAQSKHAMLTYRKGLKTKVLMQLHSQDSIMSSAASKIERLKAARAQWQKRARQLQSQMHHKLISLQTVAEKQLHQAHDMKSGLQHKLAERDEKVASLQSKYDQRQHIAEEKKAAIKTLVLEKQHEEKLSISLEVSQKKVSALRRKESKWHKMKTEWQKKETELSQRWKRHLEHELQLQKQKDDAKIAQLAQEQLSRLPVPSKSVEEMNLQALQNKIQVLKEQNALLASLGTPQQSAIQGTMQHLQEEVTRQPLSQPLAVQPLNTQPSSALQSQLLAANAQLFNTVQPVQSMQPINAQQFENHGQVSPLRLPQMSGLGREGSRGGRARTTRRARRARRARRTRGRYDD